MIKDPEFLPEKPLRNLDIFENMAVGLIWFPKEIYLNTSNIFFKVSFFFSE